MEMPIRVLAVIGKMDRAGAETFIMNLYRAIDRTKIQFDFAVHTQQKGDYDDEILSMGGRIFRFPKYNVINGISYRRAWDKFFREHKGEFKIVHGHLGSCAAMYLAAAKKAGLYAIAHSHSTVTGFEGLLYRILCFPQRFIANYFFACSQEAGINRYGKNIAEKTKLFSVIKNGIEACRYVYNPQTRDEYRKKFGLENKLVIGHIGRLTAVKNHKFLFEIFSEIKKIRSDSALVLAGRGDLEEELKNLALQEGLGDDIIFSGVRDDIPQLLQMFDIFIFPSIYEGLPVTSVEAQAAGLPCVFSHAVPEAAIITDLCLQLSLGESAAVWAERAIEHYENNPRRDTYADIKNAGFDMLHIAKDLENFYVSKLNKG